MKSTMLSCKGGQKVRNAASNRKHRDFHAVELSQTNESAHMQGCTFPMDKKGETHRKVMTLREKFEDLVLESTYLPHTLMAVICYWLASKSYYSLVPFFVPNYFFNSIMKTCSKPLPVLSKIQGGSSPVQGINLCV